MTDEAEGASADQRCAGQGDHAGRPEPSKRRDHPEAQGLQQQEEQQPGPLRRATRRDEQQQGQEPGEVERDDEGVMRAARLDRTFGEQPAGVAPRDRQLQNPQRCQQQQDRRQQAQAAIIWNPALKPGPSADIR